MKLYLHPTMPIADAAIDAYESGQHIEGRTGRVSFAPGRNQRQYRNALQSKRLLAVAREIERGHTK